MERHSEHPSFTLLVLPLSLPSSSSSSSANLFFFFAKKPRASGRPARSPFALDDGTMRGKVCDRRKNGPLPLWSSGPLELFCFHLRKGDSYREATVLNESENQWGDEGSRYHRGERESRRKLKEEPQG